MMFHASRFNVSQNVFFVNIFNKSILANAVTISPIHIIYKYSKATFGLAEGNYQVTGDMELYYQNCMFVISKMIGFYSEVERVTSHGRIDLVIKTPGYIYIMKMKLDGSADEA